MNISKRQRGLSLVEVMVALVVVLILLAGVVQIYISNKQTYRLSEASARIQENARFALEILARDIRMAGYMGCVGEFGTIVNTLNDTTSFLYNFGNAVDGFEAITANAWQPVLDSTITDPLGGSDILAIRGVFSQGVKITGQPNHSGDCHHSSSHAANLKVETTTILEDGDIVIASKTSCSQASIFQITQFNAGTVVVHNTGNAVSPGNSTKDLGACYAGNGELAKITTRVFYVRNNAAGVPSLYRKEGDGAAEELVEGVKNMQILYGVDTDGDSAANRYVRANDVSDWGQVVSVRLQLLLQSIEDNVTSEPQPYTFNNATVTPSDKRLRRVFTTTVALRNRVP